MDQVQFLAVTGVNLFKWAQNIVAQFLAVVREERKERELTTTLAVATLGLHLTFKLALADI